MNLKICKLAFSEAASLFLNLSSKELSKEERERQVKKDLMRMIMIGTSKEESRGFFEELWIHDNEKDSPDADGYEVIDIDYDIPKEYKISNDYFQGMSEAATFDHLPSFPLLEMDDPIKQTQLKENRVTFRVGYIHKGKPCAVYMTAVHPTHPHDLSAEKDLNKFFLMTIMKECTNSPDKVETTLILNENYPFSPLFHKDQEKIHELLKPLDNKKTILDAIGSEKVGLLISKLMHCEDGKFTVDPEEITKLTRTLDKKTNNLKQINEFVKKKKVERMDPQDMIYAILQIASDNGFKGMEQHFLYTKSVATVKHHPYYVLQNPDSKIKIVFMSPVTDVPIEKGMKGIRVSLLEAQPMMQELLDKDENAVLFIPVSQINREHWVFLVGNNKEGFTFFDPKAKHVSTGLTLNLEEGIKKYNNDSIKEFVRRFLLHRGQKENADAKEKHSWYITLKHMFFASSDSKDSYYYNHVKIKRHPQPFSDLDSCGFFVIAVVRFLIENINSNNTFRSIIEKYLDQYQSSELPSIKNDIATSIGYGIERFPIANLELHNHDRKEIWENPIVFKEDGRGIIPNCATLWRDLKSVINSEALLGLIASIEKKENENVEKNKIQEIDFSFCKV
jgi:hypothetical protein